MKFAIVIQGAPYTHQAPRTAYEFAREVIAQGHEIYRVFFYMDGVYVANRLITPPQDEADVHGDWTLLARENDLDLVICIASALRRGMLDTTEADRYEQPSFTVEPPFTISGLGQLVDAALNADRLVTFGA